MLHLPLRAVTRHVCSRRAVQDPNTAHSEIIQGGYSRMGTCQTLLTMRAGSACLCPLGDTANRQRPDRPFRADASSAGPRPRLVVFTYFVFALQHACSASASVHAALCSIQSTVPVLDSRMLGTTYSVGKSIKPHARAMWSGSRQDQRWVNAIWRSPNVVYSG